MTTTNRVQITMAKKASLGASTSGARMRKFRYTGESMKFVPTFGTSDEIRSDRMNADPFLLQTASDGGLNAEFVFPDDDSPLSTLLESAMCSAWTRMPFHDNDGTADSDITDAGTTTDTYVVTDDTATTGFTGASYVAGHLVRASGFTNAANNQYFRVASSTTSTVVGSSLALTAETAPPATARLKVIGFEGSVGHTVITATVVSGGGSGTPGAVTITGTTGTGTKFQATGTINGSGVLAGALVVTVNGLYSVNPTLLTAEPVTGGSLSGATVSITMSCDVTATSTGLASVALDFTTLGLQVGGFIKVGGAATLNKFGTAANNAYLRVTAIAAHALTCDHLPSGWVADSGAAKQIRVFIPDFVKNGTTIIPHVMEKGYLGQTVPTYVVVDDVVADQLDLTVTAGSKITMVQSFKGLSGSESTTSIDANPDAATTAGVMTASANVTRMCEAGSDIASPNFLREIKFSLKNNLRSIAAVAHTAPVDIRFGEAGVTGTATTYFGDDTLLAKFFAGTATSFSSIVVKDSQAIVFHVPRATYMSGGDVPVTAKNTDVMNALNFQASYDSTTTAHLCLSRFENVGA